MVIVKDGVAFGTKSKVMILNGKSSADALKSPADYATVIPGIQEDMGDVAMWGTNNLLPVEMQADIESSGVLAAAIDAKARIVIGKGPTPAKIIGLDDNGYEQLEFVVHPETSHFLETHRAFENSYAMGRDLFGYGNTFVQILLSADRKKIVAYKRMDAVQCRLSKKDPKTGKSEWVYLSSDWLQYYSTNGSAPSKESPQRITRVPLLDKDYPLYDLQSRTSGYTFMLCIQYPLTGRNYYSPSPWYTARKWVKISMSIPEMKEAMFKNQIMLKYIVEIHPKFWEIYNPKYKSAKAAEQLAIQNEFYDSVDELLVGGNNAYKSLFSTTVYDQQSNTTVPGIKVTPLDDKIKDGKLLPDGATAETQILFALMMNPALVGVDVPGGGGVRTAGSGSNIREAYLVQVVLSEAERRMISTPYNVIRDYNGWPGENVLRYPNQILTTLNTGANTQSTS